MRLIPASLRRGVDQRALAVAGAALAVLIGYGLARHTAPVGAAVVGAVVVFMAPQQWLPALALALFALVPVEYLNVPYTLVYLTPASLTLIVWVARRGRAGSVAHSEATWTLLAMWGLYVFGAWVLVTTLLSVDKRASIEWTIAFAISVMVLARCARSDAAVLSRVRATWLVLGAVLSVYALIESRLLHNNPLFAATYAGSSSNGFSQYTTWSTYRATTTLGHPLLNSTFFAVAVGLAVGTHLKTGSRWAVIAGVLGTVGVLMTESRGGLIALGAAVVGAVVVSLFEQSSRRRATRSLIIVTALVAVVGSSVAAGTLNRSASQEGNLSTSARVSLFQQGLTLAQQRPVTGFGPGALITASRGYSSNSTPGNYENSYLEIAISSGVVGVVLLVIMLAALLARSFATRNAAAFGGLAAYVTSAASFNLLSGYMPALVMLGVLAALALGSDGGSTAVTRPE